MPQAQRDPTRRLRQLQAQAQIEAHHAWRRARLWNWMYLGLGVIATILAAVAGIAGLADLVGTVGVSVMALVVAGVTAAATFLSSDKQRDSQRAQAAAWQSNADVAGNAIDMHETLTDPVIILDSINQVQRHQAAIRQGEYAPMEPIRPNPS